MTHRIACAAALLVPFACAHAQSNVTVYGILDTSVSIQKRGASVGNTKTVDSGTGYGSRLGFRGSEDLGGGLKANFLIEMGFASDTGALQQGGTAWGRQAYVGLADKTWSLTLGRQYSALWTSLITHEAFAFTYWGNTQATQMQSVSANSVAGDGGYGALSRINNSVLGTGNFGPVKASLMVAAGEPGRLINPSLTYATGPFSVTASLARFKQFAKDIPTGARADEQTAWMVGATYDFGPAKAFAGYYHYDPSEANTVLRAATVTSTHSAWLGTTVKVGAVGRVIAQVVSSRFDHPLGVGQGKSTTFGLTYEHALSKRSFLYASGGLVKNNGTSSLPLYGGTTSVAPVVAGDDPKALSFGIRHAF